MPVSPARAAAFDILLRVERDNSYASELLHSNTYHQLTTPDHALATELVMGVLRWRSRLDDEIILASSQPLKKLDLEILIALRLAVYQFGWLDRIPRRAALHESVELVKRARKRSAAPFVNAVLRKLCDHPLCSSVPPVVSPSSTQALAAAYAHPAWLVERWTEQYGFSAAEQICNHNQSIPTTAIRLRTNDAESELIAEGISLLPGGLLASARRIVSGDVTKTKVFRDGHVVIQDEGSQLVAALLGKTTPEKKSRVLDACAAPGGKTLAIADHNPGATITAVEIHPHRARLLQTLAASATHAGTKIEIIVADAVHLPVTASFERILADVPCSGTGTLARNPEIKWRITARDLAELHERQLAILRSGLTQLATGGRLIYSTCSLEKEENENVVEESLAGNGEFKLVDCRSALESMKSAGDLTWPEPSNLTRGTFLRTIPGIHPCEGFFVAMIERT
jgi:16S rRNA (cytosine967-C5)-methyltransferase